MRKKFYLIATLVLLGWHTGSAQVNRSTHRPFFSMGARTACRPAEAPAPGSRDPQAARTDSLRTVSLDQLPKIPVRAADKVTATVLTGYTVTSPSGTSSVSIAYNGNGRIKDIDETGYAETWSYVEGTHGQWTERTVQRTDKYTNKVSSTEKHVRTQDAQGRIVAEKIYTSMGDAPLKLNHSYAYEYSSSEGYDNGSEEYLSVIEDIDYLNYPEGYGYRYGLLPGGQYVRCEWSDYLREEVTRNGNDYVFTRKYKNGGGTWVTAYEKTVFTDGSGNETGYIAVTRNDDGTLSNANGSKTEVQTDTPTAGYRTGITYQYRKADGAENAIENYAWVPSSKEVYTDNYKDPHVTPDGKPRIEYSYAYDSSTQSWKETGHDINEWVKPNIMKTTTTYESESKDRKEVFYTVYSDEGEDIGSAMLFSDGGYVIQEYSATSEADKYEEFFYTVYDAQNTVQKEYKEVEYKNERTDGFSDWFSAEPIKWYVKNGSAWELMSGTLQFGDGDNRLVCTLDGKGRPVEVFEYEDGKVDDHYKYTYLDNGYVDDCYEMKADGRDEYLSDSYTRTVDSDGNYECTEFEYTEGGYAKYGKKTRWLSNGITEISYWRNGAFTVDTRYVSPLVTEEDGVRTEIYREIEENEGRLDIVETRKYVTTDRGNEHTMESYTKEDGKWVGQDKSSKFTTDTSGFTWRKVVPEVDCGLAYSTYKDLFEQTHTTYTVGFLESHIDYAWENGQWKVTDSSSNDVKVEGNTETVTQKSDYNGYSSTYSYAYKRDGEGRLLEEIRNESTTQDGETTTVYRGTFYTLDDEGRLVSLKEEGNDFGPVTTTYTYGKISVSGIEGTGVEALPQVRVSGRTVTAEGCGRIALYATDGTLVGKGSGGSVTAPARGLYILKTGKGSVKVAVQ